MEIIVKDLDNNNPDVWHRGEVLKCNDTIMFPPDTEIEFDNRESRLVEPNNRQKNLKTILSRYVKRPW